MRSLLKRYHNVSDLKLRVMTAACRRRRHSVLSGYARVTGSWSVRQPCGLA